MMKKDVKEMRGDAMDILRLGLRAVDPRNSILRYLRVENDTLRMGKKTFDLNSFEHIYVIGAGKAGASMSAAVEEVLGDRVSGGTVTVKYGHVLPTSRVAIHEASHPVPDEAGLAGSEKILDIARGAGEKDLVICLLSGGGSALMPLPAENITLAEKQETTKILLACGATIHEINAVRKHISRVKGGRLAGAAYPAMLVSLILSDVVGDDLDTIASGPTVPDYSTYGQCLEIFDKFSIRDRIPRPVLDTMIAGAEGRLPETPKPGDPIFSRTENLIVGSNMECVLAAGKGAEALGYNTMILSTMIEGETRDVAMVHAAIAKEAWKNGMPIAPPACILSGGETTVTIRGNGLGGRNMEFVLTCSQYLSGWPNVVVLSAGTDGTDGPTDAAGAVADGTTVARALSKDMDPKQFLRNNDSYHFFEQLGDLIKTGPTNTNVMDLRIMLIGRK